MACRLIIKLRSWSKLKKYVVAIASVDYRVGFEDLWLSEEIKKAVILLNSQLTPDYMYLKDFL